MKAAVFMFLFVDVINITINFYACRKQIITLYHIKETRSNIFWMTSILMTIAFAIAVVYPDIMSLFGILGGFFCTMIGWTIPYLLIIRLKSKKLIFFNFLAYWFDRGSEVVSPQKIGLHHRADFYAVRYALWSVSEHLQG